jgi:hypothetical protein
MYISQFHYVMALCSFSSPFQKPNFKPWSLGMLWWFQPFSNAIYEVLQKSPLKNSNYFTSWTILPLVHLTVQLKFDFLHWPFLRKSNYAPWKYMSNGVCAYKELAIWTNHVEVMASWLWVISELHWALIFQPYMGFSSSWTFWKGENKIYNFHVEQFSIWSFFGHVVLRSKTFHFWKLQLQVTFYFWQFLSWLDFLHS